MRQSSDPGNTSIILRGLAYYIDEIAPIERIPALAKDPQQLKAFIEGGHRTYAHSSQSLAEQAACSARKSLAAAKLSVGEIDAIVVGTSEIADPKRYPEMLSTELLLALERRDIPVIGVTLAGCANYSSSLRVACNMLVAERLNHVLVIETDQVRGAMERQLLTFGYGIGIFADGAASFVISTQDAVGDRAGGSDFELIAMAQTVLPIDKERVNPNDIWANNVLGFRGVLEKVLQRADATRTDFSKVFMPNMEMVATDLAEVLEVPRSSVYMANCSRTAHVWSCDNVINLVDHCAAEKVPAGALFLMLCQAESYYSAIVCRRR